MTKLHGKLLSILCIFMMVLLLSSSVFAAEPIDTEREVTVTLVYTDGDIPISNTTFEVYRVADVDPYGKLSLTEAFSEYPIDVDDNDQDDWQALAYTLKGYVQRDQNTLAPDFKDKTDENGVLSFNAKPGLYLIVGSSNTINKVTYSAVPFMLFVPGENTVENTWDYDISISPKYIKDEDPSDVPNQYITRKVLKIWDDTGYESIRPDEVIVQLLCDGTVFDTQTLNEGNNWRYAWDELDPQFEWQIVEKEVSGYSTLVSLEGITFSITNKYIVPVIGDDLPIEKRLSGDTPSVASAFSFELVGQSSACPMPAGSTGTQKKISINGAGNANFGEITFSEPGEYSYKVYEIKGNAEGYTYDDTVYNVTYTVTMSDGVLSTDVRAVDNNGKEVDSLVFTNKYTKPGNKLPNTGLTWWPVPFLFACGIFCCIIGLVRRNKN